MGEVGRRVSLVGGGEGRKEDPTGTAPRAERQDDGRQTNTRRPHPLHLIYENREATTREELFDAERRYGERPVREEVPLVAEWREEGDAKAALRECVEHPV